MKAAQPQMVGTHLVQGLTLQQGCESRIQVVMRIAPTHHLFCVEALRCDQASENGEQCYSQR